MTLKTGCMVGRQALMMATLISTFDQFIRVTDDPKEFFISLGESLWGRKIVESKQLRTCAECERLQKISQTLTLNE